MNISTDTLLVVALMMAVFAAVTTLGTSLILGVGFERLRNGLEILKKQSGFFSDAIHTLDRRTDSLEKQGTYFFQTLHSLEQKVTEAPKADAQPAEIKTQPQVEAAPILVSKGEALDTGAGNLLTATAGNAWTKAERAPVSRHNWSSTVVQCAGAAGQEYRSSNKASVRSGKVAPGLVESWCCRASGMSIPTSRILVHREFAHESAYGSVHETILFNNLIQ